MGWQRLFLVASQGERRREGLCPSEQVGSERAGGMVQGPDLCSTWMKRIVSSAYRYLAKSAAVSLHVQGSADVRHFATQ